MRYTLATKRELTRGFTLIEVLMIAPIVVLTIGTFVGLMVVMVGDVVSTRDRTVITYDTQNALNRIEQDTRLSTQFLVTSGTQTSPQGSDSNFTGTAAFTNTNSLILSELATDKNPADPSRALVYFVNQPNPCGATQRFNRVLLTKVIYFIKSGSLWRRTIVPTYNTNSTPDNNSVCTNPWQLDSCSPGYSAAICQTNDEEVMKNIDSMSVGYYTDADSTVDQGAANALTANTIGVTIVAKKSVAGRDIDNTGTMRATKLNSIDTTLAAPTAPTVSHTLADPNDVQFNWTAVPTATSYQVAYQINSGTWISQTLDANTLTYTVAGQRNDVINFKVAAFNGGGGSAYTTDTQTLPAWASFTLKANWIDYNTTSYQAHGFTRTSAGVVVLKGMIKNGTTGTDIVIGNLPEGYRPTSRLIFPTSTYTAGGGAYDSGTGRIAIYPNGDIVASEMSANWLALDGITFRVDDSNQVWVTPGFSNGWTNYSTNTPPTWQTLRLGLDSVGRVQSQGTIDQGTITTGTSIYLPPAAYRAALYHIFSVKIDLGSGAFGSLGANSTGGIVARGDDSTYINANFMYYPSGVGSWVNLADTSLSNNWVRYSTTYNQPGYVKGSDGIVTLRGLIKSGTNAGGETIFTLPAGYRPLKTNIFVANRAGSYGRIDVLNDGRVIVRYASPTWTSLDGINFIAEQ
jgi:Tfp pilus assembly protein PilV